MAENNGESFILTRAVSGVVGATVGRVEERVAASTRTVIEDLEPFLAEEAAPQIVDAMMPYLAERVVPQLIDGVTEHLSQTTAPNIVQGMSPTLADELIPELLERMRPYLEREFVPAVIDGISPYLIETAVPRIVDGVLPYVRAEVVPVILDDFVDDPRVRDLIREQSLGLFWDALESVRAALAKGDDVLEHIVRRLFRRDAAVDPTPESIPPGRSRSYAGVVSRAVGTGIDLALIAFVFSQGLAATLSVLGSVIDPIPAWLVAGLTSLFALVGPLYQVLCWRLVGRTIGGGIAGFGVVGAGKRVLSLPRALARSILNLLFLPLWLVGSIGVFFDPARRSWGDRLVGSWTPYRLHRSKRDAPTR